MSRIKLIVGLIFLAAGPSTRAGTYIVTSYAAGYDVLDKNANLVTANPNNLNALASNDPAYDSRAVFEYSISSTFVKGPLSSVTLSLMDSFNNAGTADPGSLVLYGAAGNGSVTTASYSDSTLLGTFNSPKKGSMATFDITSFVASLVSSGAQTFEVVVRDPSADSGQESYSNTETSVTIVGPNVLPYAAPEPSSLAMAGLSAAAGLAWSLRNRRPSSSSTRS